MNRYVIAACALIALSVTGPGALAHQDQGSIARVPAFTAYAEPNPEGVSVSEGSGVTGWSDAATHIVWYGHFQSAGKLDVSLSLRLPEASTSSLRLAVAKAHLTARAIGAGAKATTVQFGTVNIPSPGYYRFELTGISKSGTTYGDLETLILAGPAVSGAHFNLKERRNAASVHLIYPTDRDARVQWFYNEVTVKTDPLWSYYMACGWQRGYFGIQVNSPTERRIIFSVWDSGSEAVDRNKVKEQDRVALLAKGDGVFADSFGNEGTGGHSHLVYPWKTGTTYRFLVSATPQGTHTVYTGYFFFPEKNRWGLIARFRAPKDGAYMHGLYSFNEDFAGANGNQRRLAEFGNQWIRLDDGTWSELTVARFSHDATGKADRKDYGAGVTGGRFYLSNGGFVGNSIKFGDLIHRPATGRRPDISDQDLPVLP